MWNLFAVFVATIVGIITNSLSFGAVVMIGFGVSMMIGLLLFLVVFLVFLSEILWLIVFVFFFVRGFIKTGLGNRIAYKIVSLFGKFMFGLIYFLVFFEVLFVLVIFFLVVCVGGIFLFFVKVFCVACGFDFVNGTEKKMGAYVMIIVF